MHSLFHSNQCIWRTGLNQQQSTNDWRLTKMSGRLHDGHMSAKLASTGLSSAYARSDNVNCWASEARPVAATLSIRGSASDSITSLLPSARPPQCPACACLWMQELLPRPRKTTMMLMHREGWRPLLQLSW